MILSDQINDEIVRKTMERGLFCTKFTPPWENDRRRLRAGGDAAVPRAHGEIRRHKLKRKRESCL